MKNATLKGEYDLRTPVLIAGAGPAGLTLSLALSRYGVPHILLEMYPGAAHTPRAHITNQRTMEIFRDLGIEEAIEQKATPAQGMWSNAWISTMAGQEVFRSEAWGAGEEHAARYAKASPSGMCNISQNIMEPVLIEAIEDIGLADLRFSHKLESFEQDETGVSAVVVEVQSGLSFKVRADYLIGSDGARSMVAEALALPFEGDMGVGKDAGIGTVIYAWIKADLTRYTAYRPGAMYWTTEQSGINFVNVAPWDEWIAGWSLPPGVDHDLHLDEDVIIDRISQAIGDSTVEISIKGVSTWTMNRMWATHYGEGRVWCMGDAVHRHPPMNGLGSNTSVADAYNLAWKLKLIFDGKASPRLINSYEQERQPIGKQIVNRAWDSVVGFWGRFYGEFFGLHPNATQEETKRTLELLREDSPEGDAHRARFERLKEEVLEPAFNALGVELGYRYRTGSRVDDGTPEPESEGNPDVDYKATTWPGARLPHAWVEKGLRRVSTLDLVGRGLFVLLTGRGGNDWYEAAKKAEELAGVHVMVIQIDSCFGAVRDPLRAWANVRGTQPDGGILVRPDGHVAWRAQSAVGASQLPNVMVQLLDGRGSENTVNFTAASANSDSTKPVEVSP